MPFPDSVFHVLCCETARECNCFFHYSSSSSCLPASITHQEHIKQIERAPPFTPMKLGVYLLCALKSFHAVCLLSTLFCTGAITNLAHTPEHICYLSHPTSHTGADALQARPCGLVLCQMRTTSHTTEQAYNRLQSAVYSHTSGLYYLFAAC